MGENVQCEPTFQLLVIEISINLKRPVNRGVFYANILSLSKIHIMYETVQFIHSYWAYLVLFMLLIASFNAIIGFAAKKEYSATNFRIALFTLIVSHIQLLIGTHSLIEDSVKFKNFKYSYSVITGFNRTGDHSDLYL